MRRFPHLWQPSQKTGDCGARLSDIRGSGDGKGGGDGVGNKDSGEDGKKGFQGGNRHIFLSTSKLPDSSVDWSGSGNEVDDGVWFSW